jgi:hypothetical protein
MATQRKPTKGAFRAGWAITGLCILFLLMDAGMKVVKAAPSMEACAKLGLPAGLVPCIGFILLLCTVVYAIPRTAILGAVLITGFLGGAMAINMRAEQPYFNIFFPMIFGILVWVGLYLRNLKVQDLVRG